MYYEKFGFYNAPHPPLNYVPCRAMCCAVLCAVPCEAKQKDFSKVLCDDYHTLTTEGCL